MSFNTNITGQLGGNNQFVFTTTNVSADNISCTNLSATNASIGNLTVATFSPVNANVVNISTTNLNASTGNISTLNVSKINSSNISNSATIQSQNISSNSISSTTLVTNQATVNVSMTVPVIFSEDVFINNLLNVSTVNGSIGGFNTVNANKINAFVEIDALKINTSNISCSGQINSSVLASTQIFCINSEFSKVIAFEAEVTSTLKTDILNASQINASAASFGTVFATTGNFLTINTVQKNVSTINASAANFSSMNAFTSNISQLVVTEINTEFIHSDNIFSANIDATKLNTSNISVSNQINASVGDFNLVATEGLGSPFIFTEELFVNTNISAAVVNASQTNSSAINSSTFTNSGLIQSQSLSANTVNASSIGANQAVFGSLTVTGGINFSTVNISTANVSQINSSLINASNISVANTINASDIEGIVVFASSGMIAPIYVGNISSDNGSIETLASGFINTGFIASTTIEAGAINVCNISTGNISSLGTITAQNISLSNNISSVTVNCDAAKATAFILTPLLNASTINVCNMSVVSNLFADSAEFNDLGADVITAATLNGINIQGQTITGNIGGNLAAGFGISLSTTAGITTIENTGGSVTDPLNVSTINASTGNFSIINADNISGMAFSVQHAFQAASSVKDLVVGAGDILPFNNTTSTTSFVVPNLSDYQNANSRYQVQAAGIYQFGFNVFQRDSIGQFRIGIYKNGVVQGFGGQAQDQTESLACLVSCAVGDLIDVRVVVGTNAPIFMGAAATWFFGYLLEPDNAVINISTNLTVASLSATTINASVLNSSTGILKAQTVIADSIEYDTLEGESIVAQDITAVAMNISTINASTGNFSNIVCPNINSSSINYTDLDGEVINTNQIFASNIVSDNISCNDLNANNIVGNIGTNLVGGSNINISTVSGLTTISATSLKDFTFNLFYDGPQTPVTNTNTFQPNFPEQSYASGIGSWANPTPISSNGGTNGFGFTPAVAGFYKVEYAINFRNVDFTGRSNIMSRIFKNGDSVGGGESFCYPRDKSFVAFGTCTSFSVVDMLTTDKVDLRCFIAKGTNLNFNSNWDDIISSDRSTMCITFLGPL